MSGRFNSPKLQPIGVVQMFQDLYKERQGAPINLLVPGAKGRNIRGASLILKACEYDIRRVRAVLSQFFAEGWGAEHRPDLMYVSSQVPNLQAQIARAIDLQDVDREAYVRGTDSGGERTEYVRSLGKTVGPYAGWEI